MLKFKRAYGVYDADEDPLTKAIAPPTDEDSKARQIRLAQEAEAQRRSDAIDEELEKQRQAEKKTPKCIRILLLGVYVQTPSAAQLTLACRPERIW